MSNLDQAITQITTAQDHLGKARFYFRQSKDSLLPANDCGLVRLEQRLKELLSEVQGYRAEGEPE